MFRFLKYTAVHIAMCLVFIFFASWTLQLGSVAFCTGFSWMAIIMAIVALFSWLSSKE